jgi:hypothetical protein
MQRQTRAVTPPLTRIAPLDPSYTLPRLIREQCCKWFHRQKDLLHKLQHPELYQGPPNWDPQVQVILARDPSTVRERDFIDCVELFLEEIVLRAATIWQGILYESWSCITKCFFPKTKQVIDHTNVLRYPKACTITHELCCQEQWRGHHHYLYRAGVLFYSARRDSSQGQTFSQGD